MKITKFCKKCKTNITKGFKCNRCKKIIDVLVCMITVTFGYGHKCDGEEHHYCSDKCLHKSIQKEWEV